MSIIFLFTIWNDIKTFSGDICFGEDWCFMAGGIPREFLRISLSWKIPTPDGAVVGNSCHAPKRSSSKTGFISFKGVFSNASIAMFRYRSALSSWSANCCGMDLR